jgi:hypothetical protein
MFKQALPYTQTGAVASVYRCFIAILLVLLFPLLSSATETPAVIGTNLSDWKDWSTEQPFINLFKTSRAWITQAPGVWDTGEEAKLDLDADGWVRSLPEAKDANQHYRSVATLLLVGEGLGAARTGGDYVVSYEGEGRLDYGLGAKKITAHSTPGRDLIQVDKDNPSGIQIILTDTDPKHSGNYLRNIRVIPPGKLCDDAPFDYCPQAHDPACRRPACRSLEAAASDRLFHPLFLKTLAHYQALRFMNPLSANVINDQQPQVVEWADRSTLGKARWTGQAGIPPEVALALSNQTHTDPWLNMPHRASDDYIRQFARLALSTLDPARRVYVEYGNEIWNTAFSAGRWVEQQGLAAWPAATDSAYTKRVNWYGKRTAEICDIWRKVWAGAESRLVCVLGAQAANTWTANAALDCRLWEHAPCQRHGIKALAIAPYFGHYLGNPAAEAEVAAWTQEQDGGLNRLFAELDHGGQLKNGEAGGALAATARWVAQYARLAHTRGLSLLAYEGGQHLVGVGAVTDNAAITQLFVAANRDPRMGKLYLKWLENWRVAGGGLLMNYASIGPYGRFGSWGALETMGQESSPKTEALFKFIQNQPAR